MMNQITSDNISDYQIIEKPNLTGKNFNYLRTLYEINYEVDKAMEAVSFTSGEQEDKYHSLLSGLFNIKTNIITCICDTPALTLVDISNKLKFFTKEYGCIARAYNSGIACDNQSTKVLLSIINDIENLTAIEEEEQKIPN